MHRRDPAGNEPAAIAALVDLDGKRVLEVGCGTAPTNAWPLECRGHGDRHV
jgi:hypothetical protein